MGLWQPSRLPRGAGRWICLTVGDACVNHLPDQAERDGIPAALHLDVIIRCDTGTFPARNDIGFSGQWLQVRAIVPRDKQDENPYCRIQGCS